MTTLVLLRHGQSTWNRENLFTGWHDVDLSEQGEKEAADAGRLMRDEGLTPEVAHTSVLTRAVRTLWISLDEMERVWIPVRNHWRLNERHYGTLQGLDKKETAEEYGAQQLQAWRRGYTTPPPKLDWNDERHPRFDPRYRDLAPDVLPASECLADVVARMLPYWFDVIVPDLRAGRQVLVAAHGNSLRALVKHLDGIADDDIVDLNIPTGIPLVYELDDSLRPVVAGGRYLGDQAEAMARAEAVAKQAGV